MDIFWNFLQLIQLLLMFLQKIKTPGVFKLTSEVHTSAINISTEHDDTKCNGTW